MQNTTSGDSSAGAAIENLYPALIECFVIIICGYVAGRINLISETEAKGINTFVGTFSLPSLIFMSLAQLDLTSVNWLFLLSVLLSKSIVFISVIVIALLVVKPLNLGRAGLFAIFCTQSNDFAVGYPIVAALYKATHPDYASYLYLMAPISLAILNPISFVFMEIGRRRYHTYNSHDNELLLNDDNSELNNNLNETKMKMIISVCKNIFLNPIILMTILGILGNLIFQHKIPCYLGGVLDVLGSAFSASALFLLGLRMVGKVHKLRGSTLVVPGILIMVKLLALPLVTREVISILHAGYNSSETSDLSTYGFLYGTFPSAPTVFVFATQYSIDVDLIATAMVACTFISAPLMFVSAKMITITNTDPSDYINELNSFRFDISIIGIICSFWVLLVFILTKKITRLPHKITSCLILSHIMSSLGATSLNFIDINDKIYTNIPVTIYTFGVYSTRLWTTILAVTLLFLQCQSLCFVLKLQPIFILIGWGIPIILSTILLLLNKKSHLPYDERNIDFIYGLSQAIVDVSLLIICFIVTVGCLVLFQRHRRRFSRYLDLAQDIATSNDQSPQSTSSGIEVNTNIDKPSTSNNDDNIKPKCGNLPTINEGCCEDSPVVDIEDLLDKRIVNMRTDNGDNEGQDNNKVCPSHFGCQGPKRGECHGLAQQYQQPIDDDLEYIEEEPESHEPQILRHIVLLILLLCSMFVGLALSIWTLVMEELSGIYIELSFLDVTLNFGQSIIIFVIFGLDTKEILLPLLKYWRKLWFGANTLNLPSWHELNSDTKHICDQFVTHHLQSCRNSIAADKRWRIKIYKNVFTGHQFIDWLIEVGLARDRVEAVNYGRHLIEGKVLKHINGVYHFYDRNLLYTFV